MNHEFFNYTVALKEQGRERIAKADIKGYEEFKEINVIIALTERASASFAKRLGRDVSLSPTIAAYAKIARSRKPYRAMFAIETVDGFIYRGMEWDSFPLRGEGAKEFLGGDYFVILVTKDREQYIEYAAVGEEAAKMERHIQVLWSEIITAHFNGTYPEPICPLRDCGGERTISAEVVELGDTGFADGHDTLIYDDTKEQGWPLTYTAEIVEEKEDEDPI